MWVALFNALLQLTLLVLRQVERKQQLEAARVEAALELLKKAEEMVNEIDSISESVKHSPDDVLYDDANRDKPLSRGGGGHQEGGV